jgi:hypothetical protein
MGFVDHDVSTQLVVDAVRSTGIAQAGSARRVASRRRD